MEYRFASMSEVVDTATLVCKGATDEDRAIFRQWCFLSLLSVGPTKHWIKHCRLNPKNGSIKKPNDFSSLVALALYNSSDQELKYEYFGEGARVHADRASVHAVVTDSEVPQRIDLSEDAYYFHLGSNYSEVSYALVRYLAMPVDTNGELLIPEDNILAVTMFIRWHWAMRQRENQSEIQLAQQTWYQEKDRIFGDNKMPSYFDAKEFGKKYLSLIQSYKPDRF
jgi:hypothetical protein